MLVDCNNAAIQFTEGDIEKFLGIKASKMYNKYPEIMNYLNDCYLEKAERSIEVEYPFKFANEIKQLLVKYNYLPPDLVLVHTEDITIRKKAEEQLKRYSENLEELVEDRTIQLESTLEELKGQTIRIFVKDLADPHCVHLGKIETITEHIIIFNDEDHDTLIYVPIENIILIKTA